MTPDPMPPPRRFLLRRHRDPSGVSGLGVVAFGVRFGDGRIAYRWASELATTNVADDIEAVVAIHGHDGDTVVEWIDPDPLDQTTGHHDAIRRSRNCDEPYRFGDGTLGPGCDLTPQHPGPHTIMLCIGGIGEAKTWSTAAVAP